MLDNDKAKALIKKTVKESILAFAARQLGTSAKFQILDLIIPKERKIRSIVGGLETSLGTTLWEPLAKALAIENGFEIINGNLQAPEITPARIANTLQDIVTERKKMSGAYTARSSHDEIRRACLAFKDNDNKVFVNPPRGRGVDIWLRKEGVDYFFDTKTVQPNIGAFASYMEQVLTWYSYFYYRFPNRQAVARIVFPYNPHEGDFWENTMGNGNPLERNMEAWVENEFWDFCSGLEDTYGIIVNAFNELRESGELESAFNDLFK